MPGCSEESMTFFREAIKPGLVTPMENMHTSQEVLEQRADKKHPFQALTIRLLVKIITLGLENLDAFMGLYGVD